MQTTLENRKKVVVDSPRSVFKKNNIVEEKRNVKLKSEEGIEEHRCKGTKNDEGQNGTI